MRISIAMATYNGEKYLQEQLRSLEAQTRLPDELVVTDDCSTDQTLKIIEEFALKSSFPVRVFRNDVNLGYSDNFLKAANLCTGSWISFCDQDDVWLPNKLEQAAMAIERDSQLTMILQNAILCDAGLARRGRLFPNKFRPGTYSANDQYGFWVWPGFLQTVRADWLQKLDSTDRPRNYFSRHNLQSHDKWTCMVANALGGICILGEEVALYRRHDMAATGYYRKTSTRKRINQARLVGTGHYRFLSGVASASSAYLKNQVDRVSDKQLRAQLSRSAECYERLASIQQYRAEIYDSKSIDRRVRLFLRIWFSGGYIGPRFTAMGVSSLLKDASCLLTGSLASRLNNGN